MIWISGSSLPGDSDDHEKITGFEVRDSSTIFGDDYHRVLFLGDIVMYEEQYHFDSSVMGFFLLDSTSDISIPLTKYQTSGKRSHFFVFHKDSAYGINYDVRKHFNGLRWPVDSVVKSISGPKNKYRALTGRKPDSTSLSADGTTLQEFLNFPGRGDTPTIRVNLFYSSKMKKVPGSLDPVADSIKGMKFFKVEILIDSIFVASAGVMSPLQYFRTELCALRIENENEIRGYINRYKARNTAEARDQ